MYFEFVAFQFAEQALTTFNTTEEGLAFVAENVSYIKACRVFLLTIFCNKTATS